MKSTSDNSLGDTESSSSSRVVGRTSHDASEGTREKLSQRLMNISLGALGRRRLTEFQLRTSLRKKFEKKWMEIFLKKYSSEEIEEVMTDVMGRLKKAGYLNDADYAELFIRDVMQYRPHGSMWITMQLTKKGVDRDVIASAFEHIRESEDANREEGGRSDSGNMEYTAALTAAGKKLRMLDNRQADEPAAGDVRKKYEKLFRFICSRGFSASIAFKVLDELKVLKF